MHDQILTELLQEKKRALEGEGFASRKFARAAELLRNLSTGEFRDFLTTTAYVDLD